MASGLIKLVLPLLSLFGVYAIFIFSIQNGLFALIDNAIEEDRLPGSESALRTQYTSIEPVDKFCTFVMPFFWPVVDGTMPGLILHAAGFMGSLTSIWTVICIESMREKNWTRNLVVITIVGMLMQMFTIGFSLPIYLVINLIASSRTKTRLADLGRAYRLKLIPVSLVLGFIIPSILTTLSAESDSEVHEKQAIVAFWQFWPVWVSILILLPSAFLGLILPSPRARGRRLTVDDAKARFMALKFVYGFAVLSAAVPHIASWAISLSAAGVPGLYDQDYVTLLQPSYVFGNTMPWSGEKPVTIGQGVLWFLQWDQLLGTAGALLWAVAQYTDSPRCFNRGNLLSYLGLATKVFCLCAILGPAATAAELMWEKDESLLGVELFQLEKDGQPTGHPKHE